MSITLYNVFVMERQIEYFTYNVIERLCFEG